MDFLSTHCYSTRSVYLCTHCIDYHTVFFFFFSSRRRHTRYWRDWSSDVCSSDLRVRAVSSSSTRAIFLGFLLGITVEGDRSTARLAPPPIRTSAQHTPGGTTEGSQVRAVDSRCGRRRGALGPRHHSPAPAAGGGPGGRAPGGRSRRPRSCPVAPGPDRRDDRPRGRPR